MLKVVLGNKRIYNIWENNYKKYSCNIWNIFKV